MVKIVEKKDRSTILEAFPNRNLQTLGDCNAVQMTLAFKIDVNTDTMWILDAGHVLFPDDDDPFRNSFCPAKVIAVKISTREEVDRFVFPESVVPAKTNTLNDLVLDYVNGVLSFIYITDSNSQKIVVYDMNNNSSYSVKHPSMAVDPAAMVVPFPNGLPPLEIGVGVDGIAMSCDFKYVYYHVFSGFEFYRIPSNVLRNGGQDFDSKFESLGRRRHIVDGMTCSTKDYLYFTATNDSAVDRWLINDDSMKAGGYDNVTIEFAQRIAQNELEMEFPDALDINEDGVLYFMANRLNRLFQGFLDISGGNGTNFHIWRQKLNKGERSYLWRAKERTEDGPDAVRCSISSAKMKRKKFCAHCKCCYF